MKKSVFYIDGGHLYIGYTSGYLWNGWATPYFTFDEALKIMSEWHNDDSPMIYDEDADAFVIQYDDCDEPYIWKGEDIKTIDGVQHLYGIGAYSHIWDELRENDKRYLAEQINEFLEDYDPYEYRDVVNNEEELINDISEEFDDLIVFVKCYEIMNDDKLTADQRYDLLGKAIA